MSSFTSRKPLAADEPVAPESCLFITAGTFQKRPYIAPDHRKETLLDSLDFNAYKWGWRMLAYVVLDNHYHLLMQTPPSDPSRLPHIVQSAHSFSAYHWRREDPSIRGRIWWNFWDSAVSDTDSVRRLVVYLHENPRRHGATDAPETYPFSSYRAYLDADEAAVRAWEAQFPPSDLEILDAF